VAAGVASNAFMQTKLTTDGAQMVTDEIKELKP